MMATITPTTAAGLHNPNRDIIGDHIVTYSKADITQWLLGAFPVSSNKGNEVQFPCPVCDHSAFYFNVHIGHGYCHRASCHETFDVTRLIDAVGYPPELAGYVPAMQQVDMVRPVELPKDAKPIFKEDPMVEALAARGVTWKHIMKFHIQQTHNRVVVPVYDNGILVQYNSRRINRKVDPPEWFKTAGPKPYKYAPGHPITNYFLGWNECKMWDRLVLVENTFVSIWLRDLNCSTNFGSHLSDTHIVKLVRSKVGHVTFLWDEGANAQKAQRKLKDAGVPSTVIEIKGQPDDHTKDEIKEMVGWIE